MMKKLLLTAALSALVACSGSDDSPNVELYLTADGVQRPCFAEAVEDVNEEGENAVLVYADRDNQQLTFDLPINATGDNVVDHVAFIPDVADGTTFFATGTFFSEVTVNSEFRLKGNFSGNVTDGETEQYIECTFDIRRSE